VGLAKVLGSFLTNQRGNFALILGIMAPALFGIVGLAVDYSIFLSQRSQMQEAADLAALAAIREASVNGWSDATANAAVENFVSSALSDGKYTSADYRATAELDREEKRIRVSVAQDGHGYFLMGLYLQHPQIEVISEASLASATNICVLATETQGGGAIELAKKSAIVANNCSVIANSTDPKAIDVDFGSGIRAQSICTSGGWNGTSNSFSPIPIVDCPQVDDPLKDRNPPAVGKCNFKNIKIKFAAVLVPGTYCGGISISGNAVVTMLPGVYVIKDGDLELTDNSTLIGVNVGFYVTGTTAKIRFDNSSNVSLTAPKKGPLAGILVFEDRNSPTDRIFEISSKDARKLVGTIYLPKGILRVRGQSRFADLSDWTAIIAREILVEQGPEIRLNSNYASSDIPVPEGIAGKTGHAYLTR